MHVKDGIGWAPGLLRDPLGDYPAAAELAAQVGAADTDYHAYDRAVADAATGWLEARAASGGPPWALFVSFVSPHYPLAAPEPWFDLYAGADLPAPKPYAGNWRDHPALRETLRFFDYDRHFDDAARDAAIRGYLGLVSFVDDLIGQVVTALDSAGFGENTTILFTSDHGEMLGDFGLWTKQVMFEGSAGIPMILTGPGVAAGRTVDTPVSLVDVFPTVLDAAGAPPHSGPLSTLPGPPAAGIAAVPEEPGRPVFFQYHGRRFATALHACAGRLELVNSRRLIRPVFRPCPAISTNSATGPPSRRWRRFGHCSRPPRDRDPPPATLGPRRPARSARRTRRRRTVRANARATIRPYSPPASQELRFGGPCLDAPLPVVSTRGALPRAGEIFGGYIGYQRSAGQLPFR